MTDSKQNFEREKENVKLIFDVMPGNLPPGEQKAAEMPVGQQTNDKAETTSPQDPQISESAEVKKDSLLAKFLNKWVFIALGAVIILAAGGYFGYKYFLAAEPEPEPIVVQSQPLPEEWLNKYFKVSNCEDLAKCGPAADPDSDGLTNAQESKASTDPTNSDSDFDGFADGDEINIYTTDPKVADTDGDGFEDGSEVRNGFSPLMPKEKISTLEQQQIDENIAKFSQHEPTKAFMTLKQFKTNFELNSTSTPQLQLSVPKDWSESMMTNELSAITMISPDKNAYFSIAITPEHDVTELDLTKLLTARQKFALDAIKSSETEINSLRIYLYTYKTTPMVEEGAPTVYYNTQDAAFLKNGRLFVVSFYSEENSWDALQKKIEVIINSIR
ncbi:MAG: hypothetical protein AAB871_03780 [Patescibacteria group bacterium]